MSNDSTTSLLGGSRKTNGSGLKQSTVVDDHPEPLEVLRKLLGAESKGIDLADGPTNGAHDVNLEEELDFSGLSLQELAKPQKSEIADIHPHVPQTVEECMWTGGSPPCFADALR